MSQVASISFDAATWEIWPALLSGACLNLPGADTVASADELTRHYAQAGTTLSFAPTPMAHLLLDKSLSTTTALRVLLTGGDKFQPRPDQDPGIPIANHYGPTENTVVLTATEPLSPPWAKPAIGTPISNVRAYILDPSLRPAGIGVPGEIYAAGAGVARGYAGRPDLTAERFVPDPYSGVPGARLYRTGDLARWTTAGTIEFLGRADTQLKIRGYRIEPGEIEAALEDLPAVAQAVVSVISAPAGDMLAAYVVPANGTLPGSAALRSHLAGTLPEYMIPSVYVALDGLPLNSSGKLDYKSLPVPEIGPSEHDGPRDPKDEIIAGIWSEILNLPQVGIHDDFFELGGHSLVATRMLSRVRDHFGVALPLRTIFERRTVADLGDTVEAAIRAEIEQLSEAEVASQLGDPAP